MTAAVPVPNRDNVLALARLGFGNPNEAATVLAGRPQLYGHILDTITASADPDLALGALAKLLAAASDSDEIVTTLDRNEQARTMLIDVLAISTALGEHVVRHPHTWHVFTDPLLAISRPTAYGLRRTLLSAVGADADEATPCASGATDAELGQLRIGYRIALLQLAARDVTGQVDVADVAAELADLAGAAIEAALAVARAGLEDDAQPCRLAVIAMGKCGGR